MSTRINHRKRPVIAHSLRPGQSHGSPSTVAFGIVAYHLFVLLLLRSTPVDQQVGWLLLLNAPMFAAWGLATWIRSRHSFIFGLAACGMQCVIANITIVREIGDWEAIVLINGIILVVLVAITAVCWSCRGGNATVADVQLK